MKTRVGSNRYDRPIYVEGVRGAEQRNVMRYYLAFDAHLDASASVNISGI